MSISVRRGFTAALASASFAAVVVSGAPSAGADEAFYTPPSPLPAGRNGDVIKSQPSFIAGSDATRVMYLSRDSKDKVIPVTGTVMVPKKAWPGPGPRPVVGYAPFTAGLGDGCAPSKTMAGEGQGDAASIFQTGFVNALLEKGIAVAQTDYEGLGTPGDHTYVMREAEAHAVLDVIRAAQRLPNSGLPAGGPVGISGYSQGGGGSAAAVELAPAYAPELNVQGAYVGAPPADLGALAKSLDGSYAVAFLGFALVGLNTAYPETEILTKLANDKGRQLYKDAQNLCTIGALLKFPFTQSSTLTQDGRPVSAYLSEEPFRTILAKLKIGNLKPTAPVLVEHAPNDDIVPYGQGKQMAKDWCGKGATVQFNDLAGTPVFAHVGAVPAAMANSANWLADRLSGKSATTNCGKF
ncbi:lipase [Actinosynnema sp. ALI-1.44]|uniref:lipase family protein n=1 Tax=Actinosynnema sp. ALI-1.44 TaxID=1933779 RepID=UPI00097C1E86|nr:lipase family protein [Actinosynnema sp. ALI-1.44]ONI76118.1 lipase [Actinosynnema sp. ALI-1.44]